VIFVDMLLDAIRFILGPYCLRDDDQQENEREGNRAEPGNHSIHTSALKTPTFPAVPTILALHTPPAIFLSAFLAKVCVVATALKACVRGIAIPESALV
jgi:hypothetical protein